jgi:predicted ATPase
MLGSRLRFVSKQKGLQMGYPRSAIDEQNFNWFASNHTRQSLVKIELTSGQIRSLRPFSMDISYPLAAIAGRNGSGKSTILAIAACAFHNTPKGYQLADRKNPYYTFADFFIQADDDVPLEGIEVLYSIRHNRWRHPDTGEPHEAVGRQKRTKAKGGRWNDYASRIRRNVIYLGINRVVPHSEKTISKSYRYQFLEGESAGFEDAVMKEVSYVLGIAYEKFKFKNYSKHRMPSVKARACSYSGFNMGAGENALFEMFSHLYACPEGSLILVDEIELGLHDQAQLRLIDALKQIAKLRHLQFIFTTHSPTILGRVPPEGRFFIENLPSRTEIIPKISAEFAAGKLSGVNSQELGIFVEDLVAKSLVEAALSAEQRSRTKVLNIGSAEAVLRHLAGKRKESVDSALALIDGDKKNEKSKLTKAFLGALQVEAADDKSWIDSRLDFLPGASWPEKWMLETTLSECLSEFAQEYGFNSLDQADECIRNAISAGKHAEFHSLAIQLHLPRASLLPGIARLIARTKPQHFDGIRSKVQSAIASWA